LGKKEEHGGHGLIGFTRDNYYFSVRLFNPICKCPFSRKSFYMKHEEITSKIIQAFFKVYNTLGYGFLEKVYRNALYFELMDMGLKADMEKRIRVIL
jgi:hypothetical protein